MKKGLTVFLSIMLIAAAGTASAASLRGKIKNVDTDADRIDLKGGLTFFYKEGLDESKLVEGARVKLYYNDKNGKKVVRRLHVISVPQS